MRMSFQGVSSGNCISYPMTHSYGVRCRLPDRALAHELVMSLLGDEIVTPEVVSWFLTCDK